MKRTLLLLLTLTGPAMAGQQPDAPPARPDFAQMRKMEGDDLAVILGLKPAQRPALDAFLNATAPRPPMARPDAHLGFEQDLAARERGIDAMGAAEHTRIAAARTFYVSLDGRQRQVFEATMRLRHGHGGPGPGPHGPGPGGREGPAGHGPDRD
jgi:hypothetical protein